MDNLARLDFPEFVLREAAHHGVLPTDLMLEVTESRPMRAIFTASLEMAHQLEMTAVADALPEWMRHWRKRTELR
jgi:EAL domain-containing protein (putative c-di-GMP-specific phosphodiesterase class I)